MIWSGTEVANLDTTATTSDLAATQRHDQFIPVRKEDLFSALIKQGDLADPPERELFWRFARTLRTICHYEYSETLDRLRDDYYYLVLRSQATPRLTA
jgi:hypothetical protein